MLYYDRNSKFYVSKAHSKELDSPIGTTLWWLIDELADKGVTCYHVPLFNGLYYRADWHWSSCINSHAILADHKSAFTTILVRASGTSSQHHYMARVSHGSRHSLASLAVWLVEWGLTVHADQPRHNSPANGVRADQPRRIAQRAVACSAR